MKRLIDIRKSETSLFLTTFSILTLTIFINKILKVLKDTIVITDPNIGIQLIPFLKTWAFIPISILVIKGIYLCKDRYSYQTTYGVVLAIFMVVFGWYVFFVRPFEMGGVNLAEHPVADYLKGFYLMFHYWPLSLFYVACDLWPIIMFSMLFWIYVDEIVSLEQGRRFFPLFSIDIGGIMLAPLVILVSSVSGGSWEVQLELLMGIIFIFALILWILFNKLFRTHQISPAKVKQVHCRSNGFFIKNLSKKLRHSFIVNIAVVVFIFEFTDTIFDLLWKGVLVEYAPNPEKFSIYLSSIPTVSGVLATIIALFFSTALLRKLSWFHVAVIAPLLFGFLSLCFFLSYFFPALTWWIVTPLQISTLGLTLVIGTLQICLMSVAKVTVFDNAKNLAFQLCSSEEKLYARGFSSAFATRFGKAVANLTYQGSSMLWSNIKFAAPYLALILFVCVPIWLLGVAKINKHFVLRTAEDA